MEKVLDRPWSRLGRLGREREEFGGDLGRFGEKGREGVCFNPRGPN